MASKSSRSNRSVHDPMPAVIPPDQYDRWLEPATNVDDFLRMLAPYPAEVTELAEVGTGAKPPPSLF